MRVILFSLAAFATLLTTAQTTPPLEWQRSIGGSTSDQGLDIRQTSDGGFVIAGNTSSNDGDVVYNHGGFDCWVVKLNAVGNLNWQRTYGGAGDETVSTIQQGPDGGYIAAGSTNSQDGDVMGSHGNYDAWVIRLNSFGDLLWQVALGGTDSDGASSIAMTDDGGYIIAGSTYSNDDGVPGNQGSADYWVVKLDSIGVIEWQRTLGGSGHDSATDIKPTVDGGYILTGSSTSMDGDVVNTHGSDEVWVIKLDSLGNMNWQHPLGGSSLDQGSAIIQSTDGGYVAVGEARSDDGDVSGNHGFVDAWIVKLSDTGETQWQKCLGGSDFETAQSVLEMGDGGYFVLGSARSNDGDVSGNQGGQQGDYWAVRLDSEGELLWQKCLGGSNSDLGRVARQTSDGGYVLVGSSKSTDGDITGNHGNYDIWVVKLGPDDVGIADNEAAIPFTLFPNPASDAVTISFDRATSTPFQLELYDAAGRRVGTAMDGTPIMGERDVQVFLVDLPAGIYELRLNTGDRWYARRLVKL